jgi:hypothetical protein
MTRPIIALAVVLWGHGLPAERQTASPDIQEPRTESFLGNIAPIAHSIHNERGFPMAYENRGNLPFAAAVSFIERWKQLRPLGAK